MAGESVPIESYAPRKAGTREWMGMGVLALACVVYAMDLTVLELAVPAISRTLRPTSVELLWIVDIYGFFVAGLLITMGNLGDRIGRRRLLLLGAGGFIVASLLAAFSTTALLLIVARALLGLAGATVGPSTLSLIRTMFVDPAQRTFAIGLWVSSFSAGAVIGPLVGGVMLSFFWWGSVFLLAVPVMGLLLILGPRLLPEYCYPTTSGHIDVLSAGMSLAAILSVILGLKLTAEDGLSVFSALALVGGVALFAAFIDRQRRLRVPFIDLGLFRAPRFSAPLAIYAFLFVAYGGVSFLMAQYLQLVLGLPPLVAGIYTVPQFMAFIVGSVFTPLLVRRVRPGSLMAAGLVLAALGFVLFSQVQGSVGLALIVIASIIVALGLAPVITLATDLVVGGAPEEHAGTAGAISETGSELGGALGIALLGSLAAVVYRSRLPESALSLLPDDAAETARHTLGGAVEVAASLPGDAGTALIRAAGGAFAAGFQLVAIVGAVIVLLLAAVAARYLRG
jgi:DHA2 family multidrug resistance protein-like MFS transporter